MVLSQIQPGLAMIHGPVVTLEENVLLGGEVLINGRFRHTQRTGDIVHRRIGKTTAIECGRSNTDNGLTLLTSLGVLIKNQ